MNRDREQPPEMPARGGASAGRHVRPSLDEARWADAEDAVVELGRVLEAVGALADFVGLRVVRNVVGRPVVQVGTVDPDVARTLARQIRTATQQTLDADWIPTAVLLPSLRQPAGPQLAADDAVRQERRPELAAQTADLHDQQVRAVDAASLRPALVAGPGGGGTGPSRATGRAHGLGGRAPTPEGR